MTPDQIKEKLISVRHNCFIRGVLGSGSKKHGTYVAPQDDFRQAFRTVNSAYNSLKSTHTAGRRSERSARRNNG